VPDDEPLRVVLQREIELEPVRIQFREWPGYAGPLILLSSADTDADPIAVIAAELAPRYRILSLACSPHVVPPVHAARVAELLDQFGFSRPVLIALDGCAPIAILIAAHRATAGLVLIDSGDGVPESITCPVLILRTETLAIDAVEAFVVECMRCPSSG